MAQSTISGTTSRRNHIRDPESGTPNTRLQYYVDSEWETKEALRQRELEEARARAAQMEKTMRWWSDCTANWREKWSKVRNERNKAREEAKLLRTKLEISMKDANSYKHESQELEMQNEQLKKEMEKIQLILLKHADQFDKHIVHIQSNPQLRNSASINELLELYNKIDGKFKDKKSENINQNVSTTNRKSPRDEAPGDEEVSMERDIEEYVLQGAVPKHAVELYKEGSMNSLERDIAKLMEENSKIDDDKFDKRPSLLADCQNCDDPVKFQIAMLNLGIEEATKALSAEKNQEASSDENEKLEVEIKQLRIRCNEVIESRSGILTQLNELKEQYQVEIMAAQADLLDEAANREGMDQRMNELRSELERLQLENATEWGKRERLETDKITLERENKQLKNEIHELQEKLESKRTKKFCSTLDSTTRQSQQELSVAKHANVKLKKALAEKTTELTHALRRSDQYETEVKRIRGRVEELKKELATAQDEIDTITTNLRRLQRTNDDLIEQLNSANSQIQRLKSNSESCAPDVVAEIILDDKLHDNDVNTSSINYGN